MKIGKNIDKLAEVGAHEQKLTLIIHYFDRPKCKCIIFLLEIYKCN